MLLLCTKFHAFIIKCTKKLLSHYTIEAAATDNTRDPRKDQGGMEATPRVGGYEDAMGSVMPLFLRLPKIGRGGMPNRANL